jgi:hypothetical protein
MFLHNLANRVDAAHVRHDDVHRNQARLQLAVLRDCLGARLRMADYLESGLLEDVGEHRSHEERIIADQDRARHFQQG